MKPRPRGFTCRRPPRRLLARGADMAFAAPRHQGLKALRGRQTARRARRVAKARLRLVRFLSRTNFLAKFHFEKSYDNFYSPSFTTSPIVRLAPRAPGEREGYRLSLMARCNRAGLSFPAMRCMLLLRQKKFRGGQRASPPIAAPTERTTTVGKWRPARTCK